jgi:hypothetical protein
MFSKRKVYVFDLDQTLCFIDKNDVNGDEEKPKFMFSKPIKKRIEKVNKLHDDGNIIIIETARGFVSTEKWFYITLNQLRDWGVKFDTLRVGVKFAADYYIDDKGISDKDFFCDK